MSTSLAGSADVAERGSAEVGAPRPRNLAVGFLVVYLVLLLLIPAQLIFRPLGAPGTPANIWAIGGLVWWLCVVTSGLGREARTTPTRVAATLLAASVLASYANGMLNGWYAPLTNRQPTDEFWTLVPQTAQQIATTSVSGADQGLLAVAGWLGVVLVAAEGIRTWDQLESVVAWMTWLGAVVATIGLVQFFTGVDIVRYISIPGLSLNHELGGVLDRSVNRVASTAVHPIEFGVTMACLLPFALHRLSYVGARLTTVLPAMAILLGAFLSVSRSAMLALAVVGLVLLVGWPTRWRIRALLLAPFLVVAIRLTAPGVVGTLYSLFVNLGNDPSVDGRTGDYQVVSSVYDDQPWLGRGLRTFTPRSYRILDNQWLGTLLELGLIGLLVVVGFIATAYFCAWSAHLHAVTERARHLGLVLASSIAAAAFVMVSFDSWGFSMHAGMSFLSIGLAGAAWRLAREDRT